MHEVTKVDLKEINQPIEIFTQPDDINPTDIYNNNTTLAENHRDNGALPPHVTQTSPPHSPLIDALVAPDEPPLGPRVDVGNVDRLVINADPPKVRLKSASNTLFGVHQDWVHQNPGNNLDGGIKEDGKCQDT